MPDDEVFANPPQASGSGRDPHQKFRFNAKLRAKLENLAQWRIDPAFIIFPRDAQEFRGGYATVSRARLVITRRVQTSKPRVVAVKKLKVENDADLERILALALRESEFVAELSHPNIVGFEGFVEDASKRMIWLVFPWEENGNLRDFIGSGEWEIPERISLINDVAKGVEYLHGQSPPIYHGDLKSLNILVNSEYNAVITDFGSARRIGTKDFDQEAKKPDPQPRPEQTTGEESITLQAVYSVSTNTITLTGAKFTLRWAAPELLSDDPPTLACDIWALGWIAYEVMTNTIPFHDVKRDVAVVSRVLQGNLPSITDHARMSLIQALCSLMAQCWSISPEKRPTATGCLRLLRYMPMIVPARTQAGDPEASQARYAGLLLQLGEMYRLQSDFVHALDCFTKALDICATTKDTRQKADAVRGLAEVHRFKSEHSKAARFYFAALRLYTDIGDHGWRAYALWGLGEVLRSRGEYTEASMSYSEALQISTNIGDRGGRGNALEGLARIHRSRREDDHAIRLYSEALQIRMETGFSLGRASVLRNLGEVHRSRGEFSEAIEFHSESLQIFTEVGDRKGKAEALWYLASVHLSREEYDDAAVFYSKSLQIFTDIGDKVGRAYGLLGLARTRDGQGHRSEAVSCYTEPSEASREVGNSRNAAWAAKKAAALRAGEAA